MKTCLLLIAAILLHTCLYCQVQKDAGGKTKDTDKSKFKASATYLSNSVFNGRKDSLAVPYFTPSIGYYHKSGLYAKGLASVLVSSYAQRIDLFELEAGYNFDAGDNFWGYVSAAKDFYNKSSVSPTSEMAASISASASYDIANTVTVSAGGDYYLSSGSPDLVINAGLSHEFDWGDDDEWSFTPSVTANAGTQNYYDKYVQKRRLKNGRKTVNSDSTTTQTGNGFVRTVTTVTTKNPNQFAILDYDFSFSLAYDADKWGFFVTPKIAVPVHPASYITTVTARRVNNNGVTTNITKNTTYSTEQISTSFYGEAGIYIKF